MPQPKRATITAVRNASKVPTEDVHVPEYGGLVTVRGLTGGEQVELVEADNFQVAVLQKCVVKPALSLEDAQAIYDGPVGPYNQIVAAISRCNGDGAAEEALKQFPAGQPE